MIDLIVVTKDDHGEPIDPPRLLLDDRLYQSEPDSNGWRYRISFEQCLGFCEHGERESHHVRHSPIWAVPCLLGLRRYQCPGGLALRPDEMIERLVPVMVELQPLYDGSYAAPREAATKVLVALGIMEDTDTYG